MDQDENNFTNYSGENLEKRREIFDASLLMGTSPGYTSPLINSLRGLRILGKGPAMMPLADNTIGLALVTRPQLNLTDDNISRSEKLVSLYGAGQYSMSGYIRGMLDERWAASNPNVALDNKMPFITCLTEYLKTSTGFGDLQLQIDTSDPGLRQQVYQRVSSKLEDNSAFTINQTYFNPKPSVIQGLFQIWEDYISEVVSGDRQVSPRDWYLLANRIDYDCRIYHLIMNKDTEYLEHIFATVQSIPVTYPAGSIADIDNTTNTLRGEGQDDFTIQFASVGMRFDEWGLIQSFNEHSFMYNPRLRPEMRNTYYRELNAKEYIPYNYGAYPLLLPRQGEVKGEGGRTSLRTGIKLTWWVPKTA
ncbi:putative virion structural protein [Serratia phage vB_SmaM-Yubaba]|nr:putative virion structural protein [Serratia phage vB_SmaM-Sureiya]UQT03466.1 putative virion structural protein [Serratia phage vB_SmaM-Yubaba]